MQASNDYKPWLNTLTHVGVYGASYDDWVVGTIVYNSGPDNYTVAISRDAVEAQFWIQGPGQVTEGDTATFTIKSNRVIPAGETFTIELAYTGTGTDGVDYTSVSSVDMLAGTDEITVDIVTAETASAGLNFIITIDSLPNTGPIFETVTIHAENSVTCTITDDDTLILTMNDVIVDEADTTITIPVKLELEAPSGAFSVDYSFTDLGSITGGVDYDNVGGTLNFAGTAGETQDITVDIYADMADDDREQFEVFLENSTDVDSIDISAVATVTIIDGTLDPVAGTAVVNDTITKSAYTQEDSLIVQYSDDNGPPGELYWWWIYPHSAGTYDLTPEQTTLDQLEVLPMAMLRIDKQSINVVPGVGSDRYIKTRMLMARLGLDMVEFLDNINSNPDIADVDDAYLNMAMNPIDNNAVLSKLLYLSWYQIIVDSGLVSNTSEFTASVTSGDVNNAIVWQTHEFNQNISGVVTDEGAYIHSVSTTNLIIHYQRTATEYDELLVNDLNGMAGIDYGSYHEVALFQLGDDAFTIPLTWDMFNRLQAQEMMEVYQYLLRVDFNSISVTELEWYETGAFLELFKWAMIIVAVVIAVISLGTATTIAAGIISLVQAYVVSYAIGELIIFIAEQTGNEFLAAAVGVAVAIYMANPEGIDLTQLLQAESLINLSTEFASNLLLIEGVKQKELAQDIKDINTEAMKKIEAEKERRRDELVDEKLDPLFLAALQSVDTNYFPAIQGQYQYDELYNYDSLVGDFFNNRLKIGVK
jgi:hypothetical protein